MGTSLRSRVAIGRLPDVFMSASLKTINFEELANADLVVDAVYEGSYDGQLGGEPLSKLVPGVGNRGGFRMNGRGDDKRYAVRFTTGEDKDWPDQIDLNTGQFVYFGDNKTPGMSFTKLGKAVTGSCATRLNGARCGASASTDTPFLCVSVCADREVITRNPI